MEEDYKQKYLDRTINHINLVKKYGKKIGKDYSNHDADKLNELFDNYALMMKQDVFCGGTNLASNPAGLSEEEQNKVNEATFKHIVSNDHHPEKWCGKPLESFDRYNPPMSLDCRSMPDYAIDEMMADWCACSEEFGNTPYEWRSKTVPTRWIFTDEQIVHMDDVLSMMWQN